MITEGENVFLDFPSERNRKKQMGREVGGGIGMGNTCKSMADSSMCGQNHYDIIK